MNEYGVRTLIICVGATIVVGLLGWALVSLLRRYLDVSRGKATVVLLLSLVSGLSAGVIQAQQKEFNSPLRRWAGSSADVPPIMGFFAGLFAALAFVLVANVHSKWVAGQLTDVEKKSGLEGARAWLGTGNLVLVGLLSLLAWLVFDYPPASAVLLGLLVLLTYPGLVSIAGFLREPPLPEPHASERQRVLTMLDSGKITTSECAELLSALNYSETSRGSAVVTPPSKLALIGTALLFVGFFLPWFNVNPQAEAAGAFQNLAFGQALSNVINDNLNLQSVHISGSEVQHGLGWLVLLLGLGVAALPYLPLNITEHARQRTILAGLLGGTIILVYLLTQNLRFVSFGLLLVLLGYGLQLAATLHRGTDSVAMR